MEIAAKYSNKAVKVKIGHNQESKTKITTKTKNLITNK